MTYFWQNPKLPDSSDKVLDRLVRSVADLDRILNRLNKDSQLITQRFAGQEPAPLNRAYKCILDAKMDIQRYLASTGQEP
jgi:hypothetical protein